MNKGIFIIICMMTSQFHNSESANMQCKYDKYEYEVVGEIYYCWIQKFQILLEKSAHIDAVTGTHHASKDTNDVHGIWVNKGIIYFFPRGLESIFLNLKLIYILSVKLKEVHQSDLKPFPQLMELDLSENQIEILDEGLFEFNPSLEYISFTGNKIYHIHPDVFQNLFNLGNLFLNDNKCISKNAKDNKNEVQELVRTANEKCLSFDYQFLNQKMKVLEIATLILNFSAYEAKLNNLEQEVRHSKFSNFNSFQNVFQSAKNVRGRNFVPSVTNEYAENFN